MREVKGISRILYQTYLEDGETVVRILHKHLFALLRPIFFNLALFFGIPILIWISVPKLALICALIMALGAWRIFYQSVSWYFNSIIVTNLNLIDISWNGFFDRSATRIEFNQIESFSYSIVGLINTIINNGDVVITKNSGTEITVPDMFRPKKKTQVLTQLQDQFMTNKQQRQSGAIKDLLTDMLEQHILEHGLVIDDQA